MQARLGSGRMRRIAALVAAAAAVFTGAVTVAPPAVAGTTVYSVTQTIPVPPASNYTGTAGGDGWDVSMTPTSVYNIFHHAGQMTVACHKQSDALECHPARTVTDAGGHNFTTPAHSATYIDQVAQKLYAFGTRDDQTGGVVCVDLVAAVSSTNPFCGFAELTTVGEAPISGHSSIGDLVRVGNRMFAFNYATGQPVQNSQNKLMCFDLSTKAACAGQPFTVNFGNTSFTVGNNPAPTAAKIGDKVVVTADGSNGPQLGCFDTATNATCAGSWPATAPGSYVSINGAPFPKLSPTGAVQGFCLPTGTDPCFDLAGGSIATPAGMPAAIPATYGWNGGAFVLGPRVYLADGINDSVVCYNASTDASCVNYPKAMTGANLVYSVSPDPQRPTCIWINADNGSAQIQNFDAFSGQACGQGAIRVLAAQFLVDQVACQPASYTSLEILTPPRNAYSDGSVAFQDADAQPIPGIADKALDGAGKVDLSGLNLSTALGLPQFVINLNGLQGTPGEVVVRLTWTGTDDPACVPSGAPKVDAGPEVTGTAGSALALKGSASGPKPLTTTWSVATGTPCTFANPASPTTSVTCTKTGNYVLTLKGTDGTNSASDTTVAHITAGSFRCHGVSATIVGTTGADTIVGTKDRDVIVARGGNDVVRGGEGNDLICGDSGNDKLYGQDGNDKVFGRTGKDLVNGDKGNDVLGGGRGDDVLRGKVGDDILRGSADGDKLYGGTGEDALMGQPGNDTLVGDEGDDQLLGAKGNDKLFGKAGNDKLFSKEGDDYANGGTGNDNVRGGPGKDRLVGGTGANKLFGGAGNDKCGSDQDGPNQLVSCELAG